MKKIQPWILTLISGFAVYLFDKLFGSIIPWSKLNSIPILEWLNFKLSVYQFLLFIIVFAVLYLIAKSIRRDSIYTKDQEKLMKYNSQVIDEILWEWDVYFESNGRPKLTNLQSYCVRHDPPMKMAPDKFTHNFCCPMCDAVIANSDFYTPNYTKYRQFIQSHLENEWRVING